MILIKNCFFCKKEYNNKRKNGGFLSKKQFSKSKYCSSKCFNLSGNNSFWLNKENQRHSEYMKKRIKIYGHHFLGKKLSQKHRQKMSKSRIKGIKEGIIDTRKGIPNFKIRGENAWNWKGSKVGYSGLHLWIRKKLGEPIFCFNCKIIEAKKFEWANISQKYKRDLSDWIRLCTKCHRNYDYGNIKLNPL